MFATQHIPAGTRLICEEPLVALQEDKDLPDLWHKIQALTPEQQAEYWTLAQYKRRDDGTNWIPVMRAEYDGMFFTHS